MFKKGLVCVAVVIVFIMSANAFAESYFNSNNSLRGLIINKAAFDATRNSIILTLANLPECEECPGAIVATNTLKQATKRLEKINDNLISAIPDPEELTLNEKAAAGLIYRSIRDDAFAISSALDRWSEKYSSDSILNPWMIGAAIACAIVVPLAVDNQSEICNSVDNEDDCNDIGGCYWYVDQGNYGHCVDEESYLP